MKITNIHSLCLWPYVYIQTEICDDVSICIAWAVWIRFNIQSGRSKVLLSLIWYPHTLCSAQKLTKIRFHYSRIKEWVKVSLVERLHVISSVSVVRGLLLLYTICCSFMCLPFRFHLKHIYLFSFILVIVCRYFRFVLCVPMQYFANAFATSYYTKLYNWASNWFILYVRTVRMDAYLK